MSTTSSTIPTLMQLHTSATAHHSRTPQEIAPAAFWHACRGYGGATTYQSRWEDWNVWSMCGYPYDRGESRPSYQGGIPVRDDDDGDDIRLPDGGEWDTAQIENEADEASGASGSPLYSWFDNGQLYAIGVHHGTETDYIFPFSSETLSAAAGGPGLPAIINWARANWP